jgi:hypothetical protein
VKWMSHPPQVATGRALSHIFDPISGKLGEIGVTWVWVPAGGRRARGRAGSVQPQ